MSILDVVKDGLTVDVYTQVLSPIHVDLNAKPDPSKPPNAVLELVRPRIVIKRNGQLLADIAPAGNPKPAPPWADLVALAAVGLALFVLITLMRR